MLLHLDANRFGQCVQRRDLVEGRFVEGSAHQPGFVAVTAEVALAKIFQPDQTFSSVVKINFRHTNSMFAEEICDRHVMTIFFPLQIVFYQNERLLRRTTDPIKFAIRSAFLNWCDFYLADIQQRKMLPRASNKQVGSHNSDVDVAMDARDPFLGADNTSLQPTLGSNFCIRPQNCVFEHCIRSDAAVSSDDCAAAQLCGGINRGTARFALRPGTYFNEIWFPIVSQDRAVHLEIFSARPDVEPFSVVHCNAADFCALAYPIGDDRNKRDLFVRGNPLENRPVPNRDISKIKISREPVAIADVHDTLIAQSHSGSQAGVT